MELIKNYDSDSSEGSYTDEALPGLSNTIKLRYTNAPTGASLGKKGRFTGFVFLGVNIFNDSVSLLDEYIRQPVCSEWGFRSLLVDEVTRLKRELHVSLSFNIVVESIAHFDAFIEDLRRLEIQLPELQFKQEISSLPNPSKTKLFLGLMVDDSAGKWKGLVQSINSLVEKHTEGFQGEIDSEKGENSLYDPHFLHMSIGEKPYHSGLETQLAIPSPPVIHAQNYNLYCSRGRETIRIV
ncbi:unnamed protein product [Kuraishia capsulata CBS 1993]|uniref:U6 snRNA phosphodiesterase n=1 Tax=Kuraishia capsulata CBS 1993 TaxID=1382522 RepID=W6MWS9_9ASCO|nr:uncharacterized protein KUCA_T00003799001 [Kuraishia capsulata CBS 1993]CDK27820.1 unnamed protein product [Kuraishia capsulata CBS 1993]